MSYIFDAIIQCRPEIEARLMSTIGMAEKGDSVVPVTIRY
jgi:hypothetical protein